MEASKIPEIKFGGPNIEKDLTYRFYGMEMRKKMEEYFGKVETILCDFTGIETISEAFADECFGKLFEINRDGDVKTGIKYKNASHLITGTVSMAIMKRLRTIT